MSQPLPIPDHDAGGGRDVDLRLLSVQRSAPSAPSLVMPRHVLTRYVLPMGLLLLFLALLGWSARGSFLPATEVTICPVVVTRAEVQQEGTPLFQAAGWVEPRPSPVLVSSLANGIVEQLHVVAGQKVKAGQPVATLAAADATLALQQAEANLRLAEADVQSAQATVTAARAALAYPNELQALLAEAESRAAETRLLLGNLPFALQAASARLQLASDNVDRKERAGDAIAGRLLREARAELAAATSERDELLARRPALQMQLDALQRKQAALKQQLELMTDQKRAVEEGEALLAAANARREQASLAVQSARLNLERMTIRAPISGRVLTVDARPGTRLAGLDPLSEKNSSAVVSLYDPAQLQVRVDVRLEDVPQVKIGQPVSIQTAAIKEPVAGKVLWVTTQADVQKNTLQVKVAIDQPPEVITPEMLAQVTFLAPPQEQSKADAAAEPLRLLVPKNLVEQQESGQSVWLADLQQDVAVRRKVQLGRAGTKSLVEVVEGLDPTSKLIVGGRESLQDRARIRVVGSSPADGGE